MPAGDNEALFSELMIERFGEYCLSGRRNYSLKLNDFPSTSISVDESVLLNDRTILIEIDSGNMAKLLAGQYALLNGMYNGDKKKSMFLVIHYYKDTKTGCGYNRDRTLKNLNAIQHFNQEADWIPFNAYNIEEFEQIINNCESLEEFLQRVWPDESFNSSGTK